MNDNMTYRMWFEANPDRNYHIRRRGEVDSLDLVPVTIVTLIKDGVYRALSMRNIRMRAELPDTDAAAAQALREHDTITDARIGRLNGQPTSARAVLNQLRQAGGAK